MLLLNGLCNTAALSFLNALGGSPEWGDQCNSEGCAFGGIGAHSRVSKGHQFYPLCLHHDMPPITSP